MTLSSSLSLPTDQCVNRQVSTSLGLSFFIICHVAGLDEMMSFSKTKKYRRRIRLVGKDLISIWDLLRVRCQHFTDLELGLGPGKRMGLDV